jgi:hypothetical protein
MLFIANTFFEWELEGRFKGMDLKEVFAHHPFLRVLQYLPFLYSNPDDGVLVSEKPSSEYLETLKQFGIQNPAKAVTYEKEQYSRWTEIKSWGASEIVAAWAKSKGINYFSPPLEIAKKANSKVWNFAKVPSLPGASLISCAEDLRSVVSNLCSSWVLKTDQGFSGTGHRIFTREQMKEAIGFCEREWSQGRKLVLEPWVERSCDFSSQWHVDRNKGIEIIGVTRFFNTPLGIYEGTEVGLLSEMFSLDQVQWVQEHLKAAECHLKTIAQEGYFGNVGVDAMIYKHPQTQETALHPIVEVNARMTMSSALLQFHHRYRKVSKGRYFFQTQKNHTSGLLPPNSRKQLIVVH